MKRNTALLGCALVLACEVSYGQNARVLVSHAVQVELRADRADNTQWLYYQTDKKPGDSVDEWVAETSQGDLHRVVRKNGNPVSPQDQRKKIDDFIGDHAAQEKQREDAHHDDEQATALLTLLPDAFLWSRSGKRGGNTIFHFKPDPKYHPPTREAKVFAAMEGDLAVNNAQQRIASIKGHMIRAVKFGGGLLGDLKAGGSFDVERRQIGRGEWQIVATHVHINGHALIFHTIAEDEDQVKSKFKQLPTNINFQQAEQQLMNAPK